MGDISDVYNGHDFDVSVVAPQDNFDPLPAGWYMAMADEAELKATKAGTGYYLKLRFVISGEQYNNRKIFANINLRNPNLKCEEIGMGQLSALGRAIGIMNIGSSQDVLNKLLLIKLKITSSEDYGNGNDVTGYKAIEQQPVAQAQPPIQYTQQQVAQVMPATPVAQHQQVAVAPGIAPWKR